MKLNAGSGDDALRVKFCVLLVEQRLRSGAAGASEVSVTEAPAVYCHHADRLYVCMG